MHSLDEYLSFRWNLDSARGILSEITTEEYKNLLLDGIQAAKILAIVALWKLFRPKLTIQYAEAGSSKNLAINHSHKDIHTTVAWSAFIKISAFIKNLPQPGWCQMMTTSIVLPDFSEQFDSRYFFNKKKKEEIKTATHNKK